MGPPTPRARREGLCTSLCKSDPAALDLGGEPEYALMDELTCKKTCLKRAIVFSPGQCRFYACTASKLKYATQARCEAACAGGSCVLLSAVFGFGSTHECTREAASYNPGHNGP